MKQKKIKKKGKVLTRIRLTIKKAPLKNKKNNPKRIELKKYNPFLQRHTLHKEIK